ncbi:NYN domain-containing protein [Kribbella monticola]|uniref:NYN domain-containing protein n=1 Tax=Kribbella monticola TaxID=2185285 RepID=UPI000DD33360|nr:NYN domain-containing protein [Kribbella monticola]
MEEGIKRNGLPKEAVEPMDQPSAGYTSDDSRSATPSQVAKRPRRTMVYIDGFNLYYGMREKFGRKYHWLDLMKLSQRLLKDDQRLVRVKYFSARIRDDAEAASRQAIYLNALRSTGVEVILGRFQEKTITCKNCNRAWRSYEEKESDVNFCVTLLDDAHSHAFDTALLLTGDSDMSPALRLAKKQQPSSRLISIFPPERFSEELRLVADAAFHLSGTLLRQSQLPDRVVSEGKVYSRPYHWA